MISLITMEVLVKSFSDYPGQIPALIVTDIDVTGVVNTNKFILGTGQGNQIGNHNKETFVYLWVHSDNSRQIVRKSVEKDRDQTRNSLLQVVDLLSRPSVEHVFFADKRQSINLENLLQQYGWDTFQLFHKARCARDYLIFNGETVPVRAGSTLSDYTEVLSGALHSVYEFS